MQNTYVKSGSAKKREREREKKEERDDSSKFQNVTVPYGKQIHRMGIKLRERHDHY